MLEVMSETSHFEVKGKFGAEFRRFSIDPEEVKKYNLFHDILEGIFNLQEIPFVIQYIEPKNSDLLPINNDENFAVAVKVSRPILRILLQKKGESYGEVYGYKKGRTYQKAATVLRSFNTSEKPNPISHIQIKDDFHLVSSIVDVHVVPPTMRRVRLVRHENKPFGLYIRSGSSLYHTVNGYERVPAFFVSRMDKDGIAVGTGLLSVDDEITEVNGIEVMGKSIDQVNDMMVANSHNLIITVKPANQSTCLLNLPVPVVRTSASPLTHTSLYAGQRGTGSSSSADQPQYQHRGQLVTPVNGAGDARPWGRTPVPASQSPCRQYEEESDEEIITGMITL